MYSQECGKFCVCLSLDPDREGLDSDAAKTRGRSVTKGVVTEEKFDLDFLEPSLLFTYQNRNGKEVSEEESFLKKSAIFLHYFMIIDGGGGIEELLSDHIEPAILHF